MYSFPGTHEHVALRSKPEYSPKACCSAEFWSEEARQRDLALVYRNAALIQDEAGRSPSPTCESLYGSAPSEWAAASRASQECIMEHDGVAREIDGHDSQTTRPMADTMPLQYQKPAGMALGRLLQRVIQTRRTSSSYPSVGLRSLASSSSSATVSLSRRIFSMASLPTKASAHSPSASTTDNDSDTPDRKRNKDTQSQLQLQPPQQQQDQPQSHTGPRPELELQSSQSSRLSVFGNADESEANSRSTFSLPQAGMTAASAPDEHAYQSCGSLGDAARLSTHSSSAILTSLEPLRKLSKSERPQQSKRDKRKSPSRLSSRAKGLRQRWKSNRLGEWCAKKTSTWRRRGWKGDPNAETGGPWSLYGGDGAVQDVEGDEGQARRASTDKEEQRESENADRSTRKRSIGKRILSQGRQESPDSQNDHDSQDGHRAMTGRLALWGRAARDKVKSRQGKLRSHYCRERV